MNANQRRYIESVDSPELLRYVDYVDDQAEIEVPSHALSSMPFEASGQVDSDSYWKAVKKLREYGYDNSDAIVLYPRADGTWEVDEEDIERFAAVKQVASEFFTNLLGQKIPRVRFSLCGSSRDGSYTTQRMSFGGGD